MMKIKIIRNYTIVKEILSLGRKVGVGKASMVSNLIYVPRGKS